MQLVISDSDGKSYRLEIQKEKEPFFLGKKIGDKFDAGLFGLEGYTLVITGGSDKIGTPMRSDVSGSGRKEIILDYGIGQKQKRVRKRKLVIGNTISQDIVQINSKVVKKGTKPLNELIKMEKK
ncbi:MAG: 30S ribosomal protein S6e, partial [Candidatus Micrarchaeota archaeon]|nr:30S ribosomal protein S6e [Candidatus Micrarchaeota archaeon]